jgi:hypothetical protein
MTLSRSAVAACCSCASFSLRVSRATSAWAPGGEPRRVTALDALRPFTVNALRGRALAGLPPALERLFIASARRLRRRHRSGSQKHRPWDRPNSDCPTALCVCEPQAVPRGCSPAQPRQPVVLSLSTRRQTHPAAFLGRFSPLLEAEYISDVTDAVAQQLHQLSTKATFTPALAASPYRHRNHPGRPRVGHLHGSPSARGDEMSARWTPSASMVRCWCPRLTPALNKATMGIRGPSGWQSQRWKRHGAPSSNGSSRHKSATRSIASPMN